MIGQIFGHYRIESKLGEGGMGVVYKARDLHLDRFVAIKVLPPDDVSDAERMRRFVQEAKAASALNHPNIIHVYDINRAESGGSPVDFIAMELVEGKTLDSLIERKQLQVRDVLKFAVQVADALAAAHAAGIIHRDIKPGNIMVNEKGLVKILDFGLAKLNEPTGESFDSTHAAKPNTEEGAILGTVAYMSPEQAEGKRIDARSDIFSFGSVLYEMVTGRRPFVGDSKLATLSAILQKEPQPASAVVESVPPELEKIIIRCLRKDPARRLQHIDDVKNLLEELKDEYDSGRAAPVPPAGSPKPHRGPVLAAAAVLAAASVAAAVWWIGRRSPPPTNLASLTRLTFDVGLTTDPAVSPDGKLVGYASDRGASPGENGNLDIWLQQVGTGERRRLTSDPADEHEPAFSPDGSRIAYRSEQEGGGIYVVSTLGGEPRRIIREGRSPRFSPDGKLLSYWTGGQTQFGSLQGKAWVVPVAGGSPRPVQPDFQSVAFPLWSPDGKAILFVGARDDSAPPGERLDYWTTPLDGPRDRAVKTGILAALRERKVAIEYGAPAAAWLPNGTGGERILFSARSGDALNVWQVSISGETSHVVGEPQRLTMGAGVERSPAALLLPGGGLRLVFASVRENFDIWSLDVDANRGVVKGAPRRLTHDETREVRPSLSLDGRALAYTSVTEDGNRVVWRDLATGKEMVFQKAVHSRISPDGRKVAYLGDDSKTYLVSPPVGEPELICEGCWVPSSLSHSGTMLLDERAGEPISLVKLGLRRRFALIAHRPYPVSRARFSPDDHWIAFHAIPSATVRRVYIAPFRDPSDPSVAPVEEKDWIPITDGGGMERYAAWSPDGSLLYFLSERDGFRCLRAQRLDPVTKRPAGPPMDIYHFHQSRFSILLGSDPESVDPSVAADKIALAVLETTGNLWMTTLEGPGR